MTTATTGTNGTGGSATCDASFCGDPSSGCLGCAGRDQCASQVNACNADQDCQDYVACLGTCGMFGFTCYMDCGTNHPHGKSESDAIHDCLCTQCDSVCSGQNDLRCGP
jgi:hypothetical protein